MSLGPKKRPERLPLLHTLIVSIGYQTIPLQIYEGVKFSKIHQISDPAVSAVKDSRQADLDVTEKPIFQDIFLIPSRCEVGELEAPVRVEEVGAQVFSRAHGIVISQKSRYRRLKKSPAKYFLLTRQ